MNSRQFIEAITEDSRIKTLNYLEICLDGLGPEQAYMLQSMVKLLNDSYYPELRKISKLVTLDYFNPSQTKAATTDLAKPQQMFVGRTNPDLMIIPFTLDPVGVFSIVVVERLGDGTFNSNAYLFIEGMLSCVVDQKLMWVEDHFETDDNPPMILITPLEVDFSDQPFEPIHISENEQFVFRLDTVLGEL